MTTLTDRTVAARKVHRCGQCGQQIERGERHRYATGIWDGFQTYRAHQSCDEAASDLHILSHLYPEESIVLQNDLTHHDHGWLADRHPAVAIRMQVVLTPYC